MMPLEFSFAFYRKKFYKMKCNFQWLCSFPVPGTDPELVSQRLDRFILRKPTIPVQLSISVSGVKVCAVNEKEVNRFLTNLFVSVNAIS